MNDRLLPILVCALAIAPSARAEKALTPDDALRLAAERNTSLMSAILDAEAARLNVLGEEARYTLTLFGGAQAMHNENPSYSADRLSLQRADIFEGTLGLSRHFSLGTDLSLTLDAGRTKARSTDYTSLPETTTRFEPSWDGGARLLLTQPLLRGFGSEVNDALLLQARARRTQVDLLRDQTASGLVRAVLVGYWEAWYADESVRIAAESLALADELYKAAQRRAAIGTLAPVDVLPFETKVSSQREELAVAEVTSRQRGEELGRLLGFEGIPATVAALEPPTPSERSEDEAALLGLAQRASPQVRAAEAGVETARTQVFGAGESGRAQLDLQGWVEARSAAGTAKGLAGDGAEGVGGGVGVNFTVPLDADLSRMALARARIGVRSAEQDLIAARRDITAQTATQVAQERAARTRVTLALVTIDAAEKQLKAQETRLKTGTVIATDVLTAQDTLRAAKQRLARAKVDLVEASIAVDDLTGRLLERYGALFKREAEP